MAEPLSYELERILNDVQECSLGGNVCEVIVKVLDHANNVQPQLIQKLLDLCIQDPKDDIKYATKTLNIVSVILQKVNAGEFASKPDLLPSMLGIFQMLKTSIYSCSSDQIKILYFKILISYPDELYLKLEDDNEVLELLNLYFLPRIPTNLRVQPINVLHKYLKALPQDKRIKFVEQGIDIWFQKLVPSVMSFVTILDFDIETSLSTLEIIANDLLYIDYYENPNWQSILLYFYDSKKYPKIIKDLLINDSDIWHRLWIVFIKMLKNQLTKSGSSGSIINSMLHAVETAFKLDVANRCRAFQCWNVLIDNFATETIEAYINKRIKLLVIPLYSNNAKNEETVIAKINTWWHLICSYYIKLNNFVEIVLIPFLQFCFGKPLVNSMSVLIPGFLTVNTQEYCVETLVNILGHHNCDGCVSVPSVKDKILNDKYLLASKKELVHSLNTAIKIVCNNPSKLRQPYKCAWLSFIKLICEVPDDGVRNDLFKELLVMLENLIKDLHNEILADIIFNDLILTLFEGDYQLEQLLNPIHEQGHLIHKIISIILHPSFDGTYKRYDIDKAVGNIKPFADFIVKHCFHTSTVETLLNQLLGNHKSLVLWTAVTSSICENKCNTSPEILHNILMWPLKHLDLLTNKEPYISMWFALFDILVKTVGTITINDEIYEVFNVSEKINETNSLFFLKVSIMLLTQRNILGNGVECEKEARLIHKILSQIKDLKHIHPAFSDLIELVSGILNNLLNYININTAKEVLMILKNVFTLLLSNRHTDIDSELLVNLGQVLNSLQELSKIEAYAPLIQIVLGELLEFSKCFGQQETLKTTLLATLQTFLNCIDNNNPSISNIENVIQSHMQDSNSITPIVIASFTAPSALVTKKKKETSIVNTVVENGEEFVVVKSNWKFNPKKLTDKQKEKLQRKREDIPALYQDLSQSQDEFKLSTWKTDSQDTITTSTSSKSNDLKTSEKVASIIKNMPNTDVVPKILYNILTENKVKSNLSLESKDDYISKIHTPDNKKVKPRLALKDRVSRNVKNLIEKSNVQIGEKNVKSLADDVTPQLQSLTTALSPASSEINVERPSRLKKTPKKFDEMEVFAVKKRRYSLSVSHNKDSNEVSNESRVFKEKSEVKDTKLNPLPAVLDNQENQTIPGPCLAEGVLKCDVSNNALSENIMNINYEKLAKNENVENQQQDSKSNVVTLPTTTIPDNITMLFDNNMENNISVTSSTVVGTDNSQENNVPLVIKEVNLNKNTLNNKKISKRKSRIEKELAIDMVEGHPFLETQSGKRITRKKALESPVISKRKSLTQKLNKSKTSQKNTPKVDKKLKATDKLLDKSTELNTFYNNQASCFQDENGSQDIIESSQDSTVSIMSVKSSKTVKRPYVTLENIESLTPLDEIKRIPDVTPENNENIIIRDEMNHSDTRINVDSKIANDAVINCENNDDTEFSLNKTAIEHVLINLTENLDSEPIGNLRTNDVTKINDEEQPQIDLLDNNVDMDTQDIAEADTQPMESNNITIKKGESNASVDEPISFDTEKNLEHITDSVSNIDTSRIPTQDEITRSLTESLLCATEPNENESSKSSMVDEHQRKQDFLNNTLEISPIKTLSPVRENKSSSPETTGDYVVIKLSSPVQSNGEPYNKCDSPEIFTEDKVSPDKRDQSPPREESRVPTASPRSLSLKKNKPQAQVRSGGRAAQMLGLCVPVPDRLQTILNSEKTAVPEEPKKCSPLNVTARRNLRILYNSSNESIETTDDSDQSENFLKMKRNLPAADSSPAVPILKRKYADIIDDVTVSPASKRKRVSFHDPPVSTTICVKKYIEPCGIRSPSNSAAKRQEKQIRSQAGVNLKSQKRLDSLFKLDTALIKAVESFSDCDVTPNTTEDTEMSSLEPTPLVEVVKNKELNDVDPICVDLINCQDPVDNIASDLSSTAMKPLLVKEFAGKIETVGDLAKMSELEVNRLCIKAPKVEVAKKVLIDYAKKMNTAAIEMTPITEAAFSESIVVHSKVADVEMQTECTAVANVQVQTEALTTSLASTQTNTKSTVDCETQTDESGKKSSADITKSLLERPDFCEHLIEQLDLPAKQSIATSLPLSVFIDTFIQEIDNKKSSEIIDRLLEKHSSDSLNRLNDNTRLSLMEDYLSKHISSTDLILLCSNLLKKVYDNKI